MTLRLISAALFLSACSEQPTPPSDTPISSLIPQATLTIEDLKADIVSVDLLYSLTPDLENESPQMDACEDTRLNEKQIIAYFKRVADIEPRLFEHGLDAHCVFEGYLTLADGRTTSFRLRSSGISRIAQTDDTSRGFTVFAKPDWVDPFADCYEDYRGSC